MDLKLFVQLALEVKKKYPDSADWKDASHLAQQAIDSMTMVEMNDLLPGPSFPDLD